MLSLTPKQVTYNPHGTTHTTGPWHEIHECQSADKGTKGATKDDIALLQKYVVNLQMRYGETSQGRL